MKRAARTRHVVVAGVAGGAVLQELLAGDRFERVTLLTTRHFLRMPRGMSHAVLDAADWRAGLPGDADHAVLVFGSPRREREALLWHPARADLLGLATALHSQGVRTLELVLSPGIEPLGANERQRLEELGFHRPACARAAPLAWLANGSWPERLAAWMIRTVLASMQQVARAQIRPGQRPGR
ncbi:MAG: hypothetical protein K5880_11275 [Hydrogenophaga sp.]|jgi:hypothetical protein|uniref:hypothetical protein n=1 Tax=Hydrogenophaga sp. TaxID=1904254 RepID=UPI002627FFDB|nr:hypothetical protein [Hydrogenophaga sp.]MCV0439207.1 hypothetical protein [Hydrogenophaga sp.]